MLPGGRGLAGSASGHPSISNGLGGIIREVWALPGTAGTSLVVSPVPVKAILQPARRANTLPR